MKFTGLKVEPHTFLPGREICVWYIDGERVAVVYANNGSKEMKVVHEMDIECRVLRRVGVTTFLDATKESQE